MIFWVLPIIFLIIISAVTLYLNVQIGISVLITAISIIFTTIWLYILLPQREYGKWKFVENEVKKELASTIRNLFEVSKGYFEDGDVALVFEEREGVDEEALWGNARLEKLKEFSAKEKLEISEFGKHILKIGNPATFVRYKKDLSEIEFKYFKFMKPGEVLSLIKIQKLLSYLIWTIESTQVKVFRNEDKHYEENLSKYALELYKEISNFHSNHLNLFKSQNAK